MGTMTAAMPRMSDDAPTSPPPAPPPPAPTRGAPPPAMAAFPPLGWVVPGDCSSVTTVPVSRNRG